MTSSQDAMQFSISALPFGHQALFIFIIVGRVAISTENLSKWQDFSPEYYGYVTIQRCYTLLHTYPAESLQSSRQFILTSTFVSWIWLILRHLPLLWQARNPVILLDFSFLSLSTLLSASLGSFHVGAKMVVTSSINTVSPFLQRRGVFQILLWPSQWQLACPYCTIGLSDRLFDKIAEIRQGTLLEKWKTPREKGTFHDATQMLTAAKNNLRQATHIPSITATFLSK